MITLKRQRGIGLVEILVAMLIALFLLVGLVTIFGTTRFTYGAQQNLSNLQDSERLAMIMLTRVIETGGYFPDPTTSTAALSLPATAPYIVAGQAVSGTTAPDTVRARYVTVAGDGIEDCNGGNVTGLRDNVFSVNAATNALQCAVNGANPQPLVSGVQNMQVFYGIDPGNASTSSVSQITSYVPASAGISWNTVKSVRITLTFINPLAAQPGQPATLPFTIVVPVMNRI